MMNLLLIDDDHDDQFFFKEAIKEIDASIVCSCMNDGMEGIAYLESHPLPDLIFLDLNMPNMNGFDFLKKVRKEIVNTIPVVIYSTSNNPADVEKAEALGARAFLTKPNTLSDLTAHLRKVLKTDLSNNDQELQVISIASL